MISLKIKYMMSTHKEYDWPTDNECDSITDKIYDLSTNNKDF